MELGLETVFCSLLVVIEFCFYWCRLLNPRGSSTLWGSRSLPGCRERWIFLLPRPQWCWRKRACCPSLSGLRLLLQYERVVGERGRVSICPPMSVPWRGALSLVLPVFLRSTHEADLQMCANSACVWGSLLFFTDILAHTWLVRIPENLS